MKSARYYLLPLLFLCSCLNDDDEANFVGPDLCELSEACNERGSCDASSGTVVCSCDLGFSGEHCLSCDVGYHSNSGGECVIDQDCAAADPCENGTCSDESGVIDCGCDAGWSGDLCESCAPGFHDDGGDCVLDQQCIESTCSGTAAEQSCDDVGGVISCTCNAEYTGTFCASCNAAHHRDATGACVADDDCAAADPCDNGTCDDAGGVFSCACDAGWAGDLCDLCAFGFHDEGGDCVLVDCLSDADCSGNGTCNAATGSCDCTGGFSGPDCSTLPPLPVVSNLDVDCSEDPFCANTAGAVYFETFEVTPGIATGCTISFFPDDSATGLGIFVFDPQASLQNFSWAPGTVARSVTVSVQCSNAAGNSNVASIVKNVVIP